MTRLIPYWEDNKSKFNRPPRSLVSGLDNPIILDAKTQTDVVCIYNCFGITSCNHIRRAGGGAPRAEMLLKHFPTCRPSARSAQVLVSLAVTQDIY
jgi:hypothetical protein